MGNGAADGGALVAIAGLPGAPAGQTFPMLVDTGSPVTILSGPAAGGLQTVTGGFDVDDAAFTPPPVRALFRDIDLFELPLQPAGDGSVTPKGVIGGDLLRGFSVAFRFGALDAAGSGALDSTMTLWNHLGADEGFLEDAGFAVVRFTLFGGGQVTADGDPDFLGVRGPLTVPATRIVLRTCAAQDPFSPAALDTPDTAAGAVPASLLCCDPAAAFTADSGIDLSLLLDTGVGPLVLGASAWARVSAALAAGATPPPAAPVAGELFVATWPTPIAATWTTIPRFAVVDLEAGTADDPGPCAELGRSRRTEWVSYQTVMHPDARACAQPCDTDPQEPSLAQNSAAYLEVSGAVPVAIIADEEPFLQGLRFDVRPEGPELDGLIGAGALGRARAEIDYLSSQPRALLSCEQDATRDACWAAARCPRLPDRDHLHLCFGLPAHGLPPTCAPNGCSVAAPD